MEPGAIPAEATKECASCSSTTESLKSCGACKSVGYCNKDCQKAHWKAHKAECKRISGATGQRSSPRNPAKPFHAIFHGNFLHDRPEDETYKLLVDVLRLRQEDIYNLEGDIMPNTIYDGEQSSEPAFRTMLRRAEKINGFLPPWWTMEKAEECIRKNRAALAAAQEKSDIQETWKDPTMPMKLRMLGEKIWGSTPGAGGAAIGETMLRQQMAMETGDSGRDMYHLDLGGMFSRSA